MTAVTTPPRFDTAMTCALQEAADTLAAELAAGTVVDPERLQRRLDRIREELARRAAAAEASVRDYVVTWRWADRPDAGPYTTPLMIFGTPLDVEQARGIVAGVAEVPADAVDVLTVERAIPGVPLRVDLDDVRDERDNVEASEPDRSCSDCRSAPGRPCRSWSTGAALAVPHRARMD